MLAGLTIGVSGYLAATTLFWGLPSGAFAGRAAAGGLAAINAFGNLGGFVGPYLVGALTDRFGGAQAGLYALAAAMVAAGVVLATTSGRTPPPKAAPTRQATGFS